MAGLAQLPISSDDDQTGFRVPWTKRTRKRERASTSRVSHRQRLACGDRRTYDATIAPPPLDSDAEMSSKKARRRERREQNQVAARGRLSPATLFILSVGFAMLVTVLVAVVLTDRPDRGEPPFPGAVWSNAHGHWH